MGCRQNDEEPIPYQINQKADIFKGFFLNKKLQDEAGAQKNAKRSAETADRKVKAKKAKKSSPSASLDEEDEAASELKYHLQAEKVLERGVHQNFTQNIASIKAYHCTMSGHVQQCVEKYLELSGKKLNDLQKVATPCIDDHAIGADELEELSLIHI